MSLIDLLTLLLLILLFGVGGFVVTLSAFAIVQAVVFWRWRGAWRWISLTPTLLLLWQAAWVAGALEPATLLVWAIEMIDRNLLALALFPILWAVRRLSMSKAAPRAT